MQMSISIRKYTDVICQQRMRSDAIVFETNKCVKVGLVKSFIFLLFEIESMTALRVRIILKVIPPRNVKR